MQMSELEMRFTNTSYWNMARSGELVLFVVDLII
jgi:hypothetical protein